MTEDELNAVARKAGLVYFCQDGWTSPTPENKHAEGVDQEALERFASLVAEHERTRIIQMLEERNKHKDRQNFYAYIIKIIEEST